MKVSIVYWTGSGNTMMIADTLLNAVEDQGAEGGSYYVADINVDEIKDADVFCLGSPAMSGEDIEEYEFRPFYESLKPYLSGKKVLLFGSYDWGDGEWMDKWVEETKTAGAELVNDGLRYQWTPSDEQLQEAHSVMLGILK